MELEEEIILIEDNEEQEFILIEDDIQFILPATQEKTITPTKEIQEVIPDENYTGLSKVTVNAVTNKIDENIIPENIKSGVSILGVEGTAQTSNLQINDARYLFYNGARLNCINELTSAITDDCQNIESMFHACNTQLTEVPFFKTGNGTSFTRTFYQCTSITEIPQFDLKNAFGVSYMFSSCSNLTTVPELDLSKATNLSEFITYCSKLTTLGGFKNLGMNYSTSMSANTNQYRLVLTNVNLTHESLMNVINKLYDIAMKGCNAQALRLGSTNLAKLTEEEIAIATNKGWNVTT